MHSSNIKIAYDSKVSPVVHAAITYSIKKCAKTIIIGAYLFALNNKVRLIRVAPVIRGQNTVVYRSSLAAQDLWGRILHRTVYKWYPTNTYNLYYYSDIIRNMWKRIANRLMSIIPKPCKTFIRQELCVVFEIKSSQIPMYCIKIKSYLGISRTLNSQKH